LHVRESSRALQFAIIRAVAAGPMDSGALGFMRRLESMGYEWSPSAQRALAAYDKAQGF
jgi:hypothetical protein